MVLLHRLEGRPPFHPKPEFHPFAITTSIFGGPAESIALWFKSIGHEAWFSYYLTSVIAISLLVSVTMRDTKRYSALGRHE